MLQQEFYNSKQEEIKDIRESSGGEGHMSDWDKMTNEAKNAAFYAGRDNGEPIDTNTFISS